MWLLGLGFDKFVILEKYILGRNSMVICLIFPTGKLLQ